MKKCTQEATVENVLESIRNNTYQRGESVKEFVESLDMIEDSMFISLNAKWGEGKTFFIRQVELILKYLLNKKSGEIDKDQEEKILSNMSIKDVDTVRTYYPIYYNAWMYDDHQDPLMSLIFVLVKTCEKYIDTHLNRKTLGDKIKSLIKAINVSLPGVGISLGMDTFRSEDILSEIKLAEDIKSCVKDILDVIITEQAEKLVILIDELDRCRPSFAMEMLERIKHYCDDDRIIFILSVNREQLVHTITNYYGQGFDSTGYLNKFFDINIQLPTVKKMYKENLWNVRRDNQYILNEVSKQLMEYYQLSLRDSLIYKAQIGKISAGIARDETTLGQYVSLFSPIILILNIVSEEQKNQFMRGELVLLRKLFSDIEMLRRFCIRIASREIEKDKQHEYGLKKVEEVYMHFFAGKRVEQSEYVQAISGDLREACIKVCNEISE